MSNLSPTTTVFLDQREAQLATDTAAAEKQQAFEEAWKVVKAESGAIVRVVPNKGVHALFPDGRQVLFTGPDVFTLRSVLAMFEG